MVVQHNLRAMNSNRMLGLTASTQSKSTEKLSSGYKINRAADDAAGLSISEKMRKQIRGLSQASLNAADGISAVQTAEGALNEVQDMLQRMNELAVKASNGTMSADDRGYIQDEIEQLITEIDRVSETTKFNETYLLKGDMDKQGAVDFQYKDVETIKQDLYYIENGTVNVLAKDTLKKDVDSTKEYYKDSDGATAGVQIGGSTASTYVESKLVYAGNNATYYTSTATGYVELKKGDVLDSAGTYYSTSTANSEGFVESNLTAVDGSTLSSGTNYVLTSTNVVYDSKTGDSLGAGYNIGSDSTAISNYYSEISNAKLDVKDKVNYNDYISKEKVQFVDKQGNEIAANGLSRYLNDDGTVKSDADLYVKTGDKVTDIRKATDDDTAKMINAEGQFDVGALTLKLHVGADATSNNQITIDIDAMSAKAIGVEGIRVDGADDSSALDAIEAIKEALNKVSDQRSALGAIQNRLEHTIANLDNVVENTTAAESQIRDTDMATEMVKFSNNNILAQAGQAMLAQANQSNQGVLSILG